MTNENPKRASFIPTRQSLLSRLRDLDDDPSWTDFFDTYWKLIYNTAIRAGLSDAEAQDVVQETVLTVTRKIGEFRYDPKVASFKGWLLNTTRWRIADQFRKRQRGVQTAPLHSDGESTDGVAELPEPSGNILEEQWDKEFQQNLADAAVGRIKKQVKPKQWQIFELYALKEWPVERVAATLNVSIGAVHVAHHRVGKLIKEEVQRLLVKGF